MSSTKMTSFTQQGGAWRVTRWVLVIVGAVTAFVGGFILLGGDDQYVGLGGEASWRVGDIAPAWGWSLFLVGAAVLSLGILAFSARGRREARVEPDARADLIAHAIVFALVNAFVWAQDIAIGGGVDYAYWLTIPWGIGLASHAIAYTALTRR